MPFKRVWMLYEAGDYAVNRAFARMMEERGRARGMTIEPVLLHELTLLMSRAGEPSLLRAGKPERPDAVISRMRVPLYSHHLEAMGVPVFNGASVCEICNDKRRTYQFLAGLPMPDTVFVDAPPTPPQAYPVVVKPACSHGGDRVVKADDERAFAAAYQAIQPLPALYQGVAEKAGRDLRVYVLFGRIVAGVMRTARSGVVSNFKLGGAAERHRLTREEEALAKAVILRFERAGAPLCLAGVDLLYGADGPMVGEVEDVVGSRMLYQTSDIDLAALYLDELKARE